MSPTVDHSKAYVPVGAAERIDPVRVSGISTNAQPDVSAGRSLTTFNRRTAIGIAITIFLGVNC
jgi:hypothetical protein